MEGNNYIILRGDAADREEAILMCGEALYKAGYTGPDFGKNCVNREREYPTGLPTEIPVAIPHCQDGSVNTNAVCVLMLGHPVEFYRMDDDEETIQTDMLFNLAVSNPEEHLGVLQRLMGFLSDEERLTACRKMEDNQMIAFLKENIG